MLMALLSAVIILVLLCQERERAWKMCFLWPFKREDFKIVTKYISTRITKSAIAHILRDLWDFRSFLGQLELLSSCVRHLIEKRL